MKNKIKNSKRLLVLLLACFCWLCVGTNPVFAQEEAVTIQLNANISVVSNEDASIPEQTYSFKLETFDEKREVSAVDITQAKISDQGVVSFKPLSFEEAGTYYYRISQVIADTDKISYDSTIYNFVVTIYHDNNHKLAADVIAYKEGSTEKTGDIHFTNTYLLSSSQQKQDATKTQYTTQADNYWLLCTVTFILLILLLLAYRRKEDVR